MRCVCRSVSTGHLVDSIIVDNKAKGSQRNIHDAERRSSGQTRAETESITFNGETNNVHPKHRRQASAGVVRDDDNGLQLHWQRR